MPRVSGETCSIGQDLPPDGRLDGYASSKSSVTTAPFASWVSWPRPQSPASSPVPDPRHDHGELLAPAGVRGGAVLDHERAGGSFSGDRRGCGGGAAGLTEHEARGTSKTGTRSTQISSSRQRNAHLGVEALGRL